MAGASNRDHKVIDKTMPTLARMIIVRSHVREMDKLEEYLQIKSIRQELPMVEQLPDDRELFKWVMG